MHPSWFFEALLAAAFLSCSHRSASYSALGDSIDTAPRWHSGYSREGTDTDRQDYPWLFVLGSHTGQWWKHCESTIHVDVLQSPQMACTWSQYCLHTAHIRCTYCLCKTRTPLTGPKTIQESFDDEKCVLPRLMKCMNWSRIYHFYPWSSFPLRRDQNFTRCDSLVRFASFRWQFWRFGSSWFPDKYGGKDQSGILLIRVSQIVSVGLFAPYHRITRGKVVSIHPLCTVVFTCSTFLLVIPLWHVIFIFT